MNPLLAGLGLVAAAVGLNRWLDRDEHNPEFFTDASGTHPIRHGDGTHKDNGEPYQEGKVKAGKVDSNIIEDMLKRDTLGRPTELPARLQRTEQHLREGTTRLAVNTKDERRMATPAELRAYRDRLKGLVDRQDGLLNERAENRRQQKEIYSGNLSPSERAEAGKKYRTLKQREEEIGRELQRIE